MLNLKIPSTFSRAQFEHMCRAFNENAREFPAQNEKLKAVRAGWNWSSHEIPGYGYLMRKRKLFKSTTNELCEPSQIVEIEDEAVVSPATSFSSSLEMKEYVVYSATYQVPAFYFSIHDPCEQR
jgi:ubiquitin-like-conjugating enzyme ATG10